MTGKDSWETDARRHVIVTAFGVLLLIAGILLLAQTAGILPPSIPAWPPVLGGLALTFTLVAMLPTGDTPKRWAWIPAAALALVAVLLLLRVAAALEALVYLWPVAVIGAGAWLVWRGVSFRDEHRRDTPAPSPRSRDRGGRP